MTKPITETEELPHEGTVRDFRKDIARSAMQAEERWQAIAAEASEAGRNPFDDPSYLPLQHGAQAGWALASLLKWIENQASPGEAYRAACLVQMLYVDGGTENLCDDIAAEIGAEPDPERYISTAPLIPADLLAKAGERA